MRRWFVVLLVGCGACSFEHGRLSGGDGDAQCTKPWWDASYAHRFRVDTQAPAGYTLQIDATAVLAQSFTSSRDDVRVVVDDTIDIDRLITGSTLELMMPAEGTVSIYTGNIAPPSPLADPSRVYRFAESFESFAVGDNVAARFDALPPSEWRVADDLGNHIFHAQGAARHPAAIVGMSMTDGEIRARMRWGLGGTQQHNGLAARGSNMLPATMDGFVGQLQGDSNRTRIAEYSDGFSPPAELTSQGFTVERGRWYELRLRFLGDDLALVIDGTPTLATTKTGADGTHVGLYAHDCDVDYDDVRVRMYQQPEPAYTLGPDEPRCAP
ncbi:MAG TPA: hypothetical protein VMZ53_16315 [Kofleriaceae bacterium]|nr:hypothetical protein [Kofleriaceae bacterium]